MPGITESDIYVPLFCSVPEGATWCLHFPPLQTYGQKKVAMVSVIFMCHRELAGNGSGSLVLFIYLFCIFCIAPDNFLLEAYISTEPDVNVRKDRSDTETPLCFITHKITS